MWQTLLQPEYLLEPNPGPPGQFRILLLLLGVGALGGLLLSITLWRRPRGLGWGIVVSEAALAVLAWTLIACSLAAVPYLSMRVLVFGACLAALALPPAAWIVHAERADVWRSHWRALGGEIGFGEAAIPVGSTLLLTAAHLAGMTLVAGYYHWDPRAGALLLLALLGPQWDRRLRGRWVHVEGLAPLFLLYAVLLARWVVLIAAKLFFTYPGFSLPAPWSAWLSVDLTLAIACTWTLATQTYALLRAQRREQILLPALAVGLLALTLVWSAYTYVHNMTHGVTGSDPYCYAQMGVDVVQSGLPTHRFPLAVRMQELGVFPEAGVHLGYHLPFDASGQSATVWPAGQALFEALGYLLDGERGLCAVTPVLGWLCLLALAALGWELTRGREAGERLWVMALAVFLLATSYAQIERLVVPMADPAAVLFTTLTVWCCLRAARVASAGPRYLWELGSGLAFGMAYLVRHTQLVLAASVLLVVWLSPSTRRQRLGLLATFAGGGLLLGLPDLLYHRWVMGAWLRPESLELRHFSLAFMGPMLGRVLRDLLAAREFLYVAPLVAYGCWRQWRADRVRWAVLCTWVGAILLVHLPYEALRLRDLLSIFPVLCLWASEGLVGLWHSLAPRWERAGARPFLTGLALAWLLAALLWLRTGRTLALARATDFDAFGHLNAKQRAGFLQIGRDTEPQAVIGASLNSGALELHSGRAAFRPAVWRTGELYTFVDDALGRGVPLYLLEDGLEMGPPVAAARQRYELRLVGRYDIPFYHTGGGSTGGRVALYRVLALGR